MWWLSENPPQSICLRCPCPARRYPLGWSPTGQDDAVKFLPDFAGPVIPAHIRSRHKGDAFLLHHIHFAVNNPFSSFMLGIPYISRPPTRSFRSNTVTLCPRLFNWSAAARPAGRSRSPPPFTCADAGRVGTGHPLVIRLFNNGPFIFLYRYRIAV